MSDAFESILGEGLGLGNPVEISAPDAPMLLLRLPMTSVDNEELVLISAYDDAVAGELSAHIVALQALAAEATTPIPAAPVQPVAARNMEMRTPPPAAPAPMAPPPAPVMSAPVSSIPTSTSGRPSCPS